MARQGKTIYWKVAITSTDVDLETSSLVLGEWGDTEEPTNFLSIISNAPDVIRFDSVPGAIPLQKEATISAQPDGDEDSEGAKEITCNVSLVAEGLDTDTVNRPKVAALSGKTKNVYFYDVTLGIVKKAILLKMNAGFESKGNNAETWTITGTEGDDYNAVIQEKQLPLV